MVDSFSANTRTFCLYEFLRTKAANAVVRSLQTCLKCNCCTSLDVYISVVSEMVALFKMCTVKTSIPKSKYNMYKTKS